MYFMSNQRNGSYYCEVWENPQWNTCTANGSKQDTDHSKYTDKGLPGIIKSVFQSQVGLGSLSLSNITNATSHGPADSKHTDMFIHILFTSKLSNELFTDEEPTKTIHQRRDIFSRNF